MTCQRAACALEEIAFLKPPIFGVLTWTIFGVRPWVSGRGGGVLSKKRGPFGPGQEPQGGSVSAARRIGAEIFGMGSWAQAGKGHPLEGGWVGPKGHPLPHRRPFLTLPY